MSELSKLPEPGDKKKFLLILPRMQGFFSLVFQVVGHAHEAEKAGMVPVVYFNRHCPYWSDAGYQGARNVWEYFFEPLSDLTVNQLFSVDQSALEDCSVRGFETLAASTDIQVTNRYPAVIEYKSPIGVCFQRRFVNRLLAQFLILKPHIQQKVDDFCRTHFQSTPLLGVHYRGIEKTHGQVKDWVVSREAPDLRGFYFREIRSFLKKQPTARIFIATDSAQFLDDARADFGESVISRDAIRLKKEEEAVGLHFSEQTKTNGHLLGEEVLLDALLLARTNFLIHGVSNVSNAALFFNPQLGHFDVEVRHGRTAVYLRREFYRQVESFSPGVANRLQRLENFVRR